MVSTLFRDPQARSSAFAALRTPQPQAFGSLNRVETLDSASNYYVVKVLVYTFVVSNVFVKLMPCLLDLHHHPHHHHQTHLFVDHL